jgi:putative intracellular protease/amidase/YHS domain-containing protein
MNRRDLLQLSAVVGLATTGARAGETPASKEPNAKQPAGASISPLTPPADGHIPVAFLLSKGAVVIDFAGPWEVFSNVHVSGPRPEPFELYTVAETKAPIQASGGMLVVPNYTLADAPHPKIVVIPAQADPSEAVVRWLRATSASTDITMSICTGAFVLAKSGLVSGKPVTTHHGAYTELAMTYPDVVVKRGARFVEVGNISSSGGLTSGMDLALHVVERYFGRTVALRTADDLEYQGLGWLNADSNSIYAQRRVSTDAHPVCAICEMDVDVASAPRSLYLGHTYYFCTTSHKTLFDSAPDRFMKLVGAG